MTPNEALVLADLASVVDAMPAHGIHHKGADIGRALASIASAIALSGPPRGRRRL